jgi:hypothetical protein
MAEVTTLRRRMTGDLAHLAAPTAFARQVAALRRID